MQSIKVLRQAIKTQYITESARRERNAAWYYSTSYELLRPSNGRYFHCIPFVIPTMRIIPRTVPPHFALFSFSTNELNVLSVLHSWYWHQIADCITSSFFFNHIWEVPVMEQNSHCWKSRFFQSENDERKNCFCFARIN